MFRLPSAFTRLVNALASLPSIGPRQATRLAFYLVRKGAESLDALAEDIRSAARLKTCARCFFIHDEEGTLCSICNDTGRDQGLIMIVEKETDLISLENTRKFKGRYLIVGEIPKTGVLEEWQKLRLQNLKRSMEKDLGGKAKEIILAFNPSTTGDFHASVMAKELEPVTSKLSRLGRGLPMGGEIEFADDETLGSALQGRN